MKKKVISMLLATAMVAALFAGCGKKGSSSGDEVVLKWAIWDQSTTQYWTDIKEAYEASHENVKIEMVDLGSTDYMTVLATELSGSGTDFDVVTIKDVPGYATLVQKNAIIALDDYIKEVEEFKQKHGIIKPHVIAHSFGGRIAIKLASEDNNIDKIIS